MSNETVIVGKTSAGKEIGYKMPLNKNLYEICFTSGGQLPSELKGGWNDIRQMVNKIESYIASSAPVKKKKNAKS